MVPIAGKPILQRNIELLALWGITEIAVNLHHCPDVITTYLGDGSRWGVKLTYSFEPVLLGTAGAVKRLASFVQSTFLVLYGDNLLNCNLGRLLACHRERGGVATVALHCREDVSQSGVAEMDDHDRILRFVEKPQPGQTTSHWVSAGLLVLEPAVLDHIPSDRPSDFGREILPGLIEQGQPVYGCCLAPHEGPWWIDTPADLARVQAAFQEVMTV